jgi:hypothetical protein
MRGVLRSGLAVRADGAQRRDEQDEVMGGATAAVDLYWIPLGAGGHSVRFNGRVFEALSVAREHRPRGALYHAALVIGLDGERYTIEIAPSPDANEATRGVVGTSAVGSRRLGRVRLSLRGALLAGWIHPGSRLRGRRPAPHQRGSAHGPAADRACGGGAASGLVRD